MHQPFPRGACRGISVLWAGGQGFFFPGHMDGGLVLDWQSLVCPFVFQSFLGCVPFWHRSRKFQVVISSWCNFLKSIKFLFFQKNEWKFQVGDSLPPGVDPKKKRPRTRNSCNHASKHWPPNTSMGENLARHTPISTNCFCVEPGLTHTDVYQLFCVTTFVVLVSDLQIITYNTSNVWGEVAPVLDPETVESPQSIISLKCKK